MDNTKTLGPILMKLGMHTYLMGLLSESTAHRNLHIFNEPADL
jgi:hypothetical protein